MTYDYSELSCIILAGGKSRRMGQDKAKLVWNNKTFLEWQIEKAESLGIQDILISGYRGVDCKYPVIPDIYENRGPLGGLHACFLNAKHTDCLILSIDTPKIQIELLDAMIIQHKKDQNQVTILSHGDKIEPLLGIYQTDNVETLEEIIKERSASVRAYLKTQKVGYFDYDGPEDMLANYNHMEEYLDLISKS